ncbi:MAG: glycosyltransferase [Luteimonas sp.]
MLSIIVPAHDEAHLIGATLGALREATTTLRLACEMIVVDDASSDETGDIARDHGARVVRVEHRHIAAARNAGAQVAQGDALLFVDADTLVHADVIDAAMTVLREGAAGGGAAVKLQGNVALHERLAADVFAFLFRLTRIAPGCFIFCTRDAFAAAGGFDQRYYAGEDVAISRALSRQGRFVILRQSVFTSDRKLRTFSAAEHLRLVLRVAWRGRQVLRSRDALALWYGGRRK